MKGGPCQNSSAVSQMRRGRGRKRRVSPARIWSQPSFWPIQMRQGRCFSSLLTFTRINSKSPTKASRLTHLCVPVCWWRSCRLLGDGGRWLSVQVERRGPTEPSSSLLLALTDPLQKREERQMKPFSFLFSRSMTRQRRNSLPLPPRDAFRCIPENPAPLRLAFFLSDDVFCGTSVGGGT